MNEFSCMEETVNKMCESLTNDPHSWIFETHHFNHKDSSIKYWNPWSIEKTVTKIWNGRSCDVVFSYKQGSRIYDAYVLAREQQDSAAQQKVINQFKKKEEKESTRNLKSWWEFWK